LKLYDALLDLLFNIIITYSIIELQLTAFTATDPNYAVVAMDMIVEKMIGSLQSIVEKNQF